MRSQAIIGVISFIWLGMMLAIGLEIMIIMEGTLLLKPISFEVVRNIFGSFNKVQCVLLLALIIPLFTGSISVWEVAGIFILAFFLILQIFFLFPTLSQQVDLYAVGIMPPAGSAVTLEHRLYGILEILKLCTVTFLGFRFLLTLRQ